MINLNRWIEISEIEETSERSQIILNEIQPQLREILDQFISTYQNQAPELEHYYKHSYENTLRTTISDAKNPKYSEKTKKYGQKGFVELREQRFFKEPYNESIYTVLKVEFHLAKQQIRIEMGSDFYPFHIGVQKGNEDKINEMFHTLPEDIEIWVIDDGVKRIPHEEFKEEIKKYVKNRRTPSLHFGKIISLSDQISESSLITQMWDAYQKMTPIRGFLNEETQLHASSTQVFEKLKENQDPLSIKVFNRQYDIKFDEVAKVKTHETKQPFSVYENDQLIVEGHFHFFHRELNTAKEVIGVKIKNRGMIYTQIRSLQTNQTNGWLIKKSFYHRGKYNKNNENQTYQENAFRILKAHGLEVSEDNSFLVAQFDSATGEFVQPITYVKANLITAALIFMDVKGLIALPKEESENNRFLVIDDELETIETLNVSFNLISILETIEGSELTFSKDIIRDFHLNLTCLDDKHFVILNGISGTGKTQLCKVYANAVYGLDAEAENPYLKIISVRPDWMDSTALFGYYCFRLA